ncbi:MAG: T9SS type B sorting domain-containing protein [Flavobacteriales bacterium]
MLWPGRILWLCFFLLLVKGYAQEARQGAATISSSKIVNEYAYLIADAKKGTTSLKLNNAQLNSNSRFSSNLSPGDLLFVLQAQGALVSVAKDSSYGSVLSYNGAGINEFVQVRSVSGNIVTIDCALKNDYSAAGKTMVVRVPRYQSLTINSNGLLSADAWNGNQGGVVVLEVSGNLKINGKIDVSEKGFRGGGYDNGTYKVTDIFDKQQVVSPDSNASAEKGESIAGYQNDYDLLGGRYGRGAIANGGGGGNSHNSGGGGGANGGDIAGWTGYGNPSHGNFHWIHAWNLEGNNFWLQHSSGGGRGGYSYSKVQKDPTVVAPEDSLWQGDLRRNNGGFGGRPLQSDPLSSLIFFGGGGGAGDANNHAVDTAGGTGGGIVVLVVKGNVSGSGSIIADGGKGGDTNPAGTLNDAGGGGGGGGSIVINAAGTISGISLQANGGRGGSQLIGNLTTKQKYEAEGPGGGGGGGYVVTTNSVAAVSVLGGDNGITTSQSMVNFVHNGATRGGSGFSGVITSPVYQPVKVEVKHDTLCAGQTATLSANPVGGIVSLVEWYTAPAGGVPIHTGGTYSFKASVSQCYYVQYCPNNYRDTVCAKVETAPVFDLGNAVYLCAGKSVELDAGNANSYIWNTGERTRKIAVKNAGKYWVSLNASACSASDSVNVFLSPNPFDLGADISVCEGNLVVLDAGYWSSYSWSTGANTKTIGVSAPGVYKVSVSSGLCSGIDSIKVTMLPLPSFKISSDTICAGGEGELEVVINDPLNNASNWIVQWQGGGTGLKKTFSAEGKYLAKVTNKTTLCADTASGYVFIDPPFEIDLGPDRNICDGDSVLLKVSNAYSEIVWNGAKEASSLLVKETGGHWVEVTNSVGCKATDNVQVNVLSFTGFTLGDDIVACTGEKVTIGTSITTDQYLWSNGAITPEITVNTDGAYTLMISNEIACTAMDTVNVVFLPYPKVYPANDTILCFLDAKGEVVMMAEQKTGYRYWWSTGDTTAVIKVKEEGIYLLEIQLPAVSCVYTKEVKVENYCDANIFFPTAFTPNSDGINDVFHTPNFALQSYQLMIFDRWGKKLFETVDPERGWDGRYQGGLVQEDVYVWKVNYAIEQEDGIVVKRLEVGRVALLR